MKSFNYFQFIWATICFIFFGCTKPQITGVVVDNNNEPIQEIEVKVQGTQFKTLTDKNGEYSIEYVPGKVLVLFEKTGYTKNNLSFDIATESKLPADTVRLIKFPDKEEVKMLILKDLSFPIIESGEFNIQDGVYGFEDRTEKLLQKLQSEGLLTYYSEGGFFSYVEGELTTKGKEYALSGPLATSNGRILIIRVKLYEAVFSEVNEIIWKTDGSPKAEVNYSLMRKVTPFGKVLKNLSDGEFTKSLKIIFDENNNSWQIR